jgi:drug/metabolite transporter (DMT)-like permease
MVIPFYGITIVAIRSIKRRFVAGTKNQESQGLWFFKNVRIFLFLIGGVLLLSYLLVFVIPTEDFIYMLGDLPSSIATIMIISLFVLIPGLGSIFFLKLKRKLERK